MTCVLAENNQIKSLVGVFMMVGRMEAAISFIQVRIGFLNAIIKESGGPKRPQP